MSQMDQYCRWYFLSGRKGRVTLATLILAIGLVGCATTLPPDVVPRKSLFEGTFFRPRISPDGTKLAFLGLHDRQMHLFIRDLTTMEDRRVKLDFREIRRGIDTFFWLSDSQHILYMQDNFGDENYNLYFVRYDSDEVKALAPIKGSSVKFLAMSQEKPSELLILSNGRLKTRFDVVHVDLKQETYWPEFENPGDVDDWIVDNNLQIRGIVKDLENDPKLRGQEIRMWSEATRTFEPIRGLPDSFHFNKVLTLSNDRRWLWVISNYKSNFSQVLKIDLAGDSSSSHTQGVSEKLEVAFSDPGFDVRPEQVSFDNTYSSIKFVQTDRERGELIAFGQVKEDVSLLKHKLNSEVSLLSRDGNDNRWVVAPLSDNRPVSFYLFDRGTSTLTSLFDKTQDPVTYPYMSMHPIHVRTRDGLALLAYLTLPKAAYGPSKAYSRIPKYPIPVPMVVLVHGGPVARDSWGFDPEVQWLVNRGYAVLQVNFRGSSGLGYAYRKAGDRELGRKMTYDLIDATNWAIQSGYTFRNTVCIMGGSYGGFAVFSALSQFPNTYKCGISYSGLSDLTSFFDEVRPDWQPHIAEWTEMIAPKPNLMAEAKDRSPLFFADQIKAPLLIIHGINDSRVIRSQSERMYKRLTELKKPVEFREYLETGHALGPSALFRIEEFLHNQLGGFLEEQTIMEGRLEMYGY